MVCPIILDLDNNGIQTTTQANGVYFDHTGDGFAEKAAWTAGNDGLLVWDRNNNGIIDDV